jgi:hypothetical protein
MSALISAEPLRLRTLRVTRYVAIGMLGLTVMLAVLELSGLEPSSSAGRLR